MRSGDRPFELCYGHNLMKGSARLVFNNILKNLLLTDECAVIPGM
jgi:hypothetical protein